MIGRTAVISAMRSAGHGYAAINATLDATGIVVTADHRRVRKLPANQRAAIGALTARGIKVRMIARDVFRVGDEIMLGAGLFEMAGKALAA